MIISQFLTRGHHGLNGNQSNHEHHSKACPHHPCHHLLQAQVIHAHHQEAQPCDEEGNDEEREDHIDDSHGVINKVGEELPEKK